MLSATLFGTPMPPGLRFRKGAKAGESLWVSGSLGDAALGLKLLTGQLPKWTPDECPGLCERYFIPQPRLEIMAQIAPYITAATDISDGLMADARRLCRASQVGAEIWQPKLPVHPEAAKLLQMHPELKETVATAGDDYELLFSAPAEQETALRYTASRLGIALTPIGTLTPRPGQLLLLNEQGRPVGLAREGYEHFA